MKKKEGFVDIEGYSFHYQTIGEFEGSNSFIIFLHEGLGSIAQWKDFPEKLCKATRMPALLYERHGYGLSSPPNDYRSQDFLHYEAYTALPGILQKLNIVGPHFLFGHSDGATIALLYASQNPTQLQALVAVAPHVFLENKSIQGIARTKKAYLNGRLKPLEKYHGNHTDKVVLSWTNFWLNPANRDWNMRNELEKITKPVLFIQGTKDMFGTLQQGKEIKNRISGFYRELILENCGHTPHFEKQHEVIKTSVDFFDRK